MNQSRYRETFSVLALAIAIGVMWVSPAFGAYPQTISSNSPFVNLPRPSDDPRWADAFSHWDKRSDTDEVMAAIETFKAISADQPDRMEPYMWLCRSYFVAALRNRSQRDDYAKLAEAAGEKALAIKPGDDNIQYWYAASIVLHREFTAAELEDVRAFGKRYRHVSPIPGYSDPLFKQAAPLWDRRIEKDKVLALIDVLKKIEAENPGRIEPKIWLTAAYYAMRMHEQDDDANAAWQKKGIESAKDAMEIEPRNPAANFWAACCQGEYGISTNPLNIARYALDIGKELQLIVEEDPQYMFGGFARYFAGAIGATGPLVAKIAEMLGFPEDLIVRITGFAIDFEPDYLDNHYCLALMMFELGQKEEAKKELLLTVNGDPAKLQGFEAENRYIQKEAKKFYEENFPEE
jgi:hypothetical protein